METQNLLFLIGLSLAIGIILRPEIALTSLGALTLIGSPVIVAVTPYGIIAAIPVFLIGAALIGFGDLIRHARTSKMLRKVQHEELMRELRRLPASVPPTKGER